MLMHHVLITLALTSIQGHTYLNRENNHCSIISETVQAMPMRFVVKIVQLKVYNNIIFSHSDALRCSSLKVTRKHAHYVNVKHINYNPKGSPFGIALVQNGK